MSDYYRWQITLIPENPDGIIASSPTRPPWWRRILQRIVLGWRWVPYQRPPDPGPQWSYTGEPPCLT